MPIQNNDEIQLRTDIGGYLYSSAPLNVSMGDCYVKTLPWTTTSWNKSNTQMSQFYGFEYTVSTNPNPITHNSGAGDTTVSVTTQKGNTDWNNGSPYTSDSSGNSTTYTWLTVTNVNSSNATFSATFTENGPSSSRNGYITIKNLKESNLIVSVTQDASDPD